MNARFVRFQLLDLLWTLVELHFFCTCSCVTLFLRWNGIAFRTRAGCGTSYGTSNGDAGHAAVRVIPQSYESLDCRLDTRVTRVCYVLFT